MSTPRDFRYSVATAYGRVAVVGGCYGYRKALAVRPVREPKAPQYSVDHIPTGRRVVKLDDRSAAIRFARELDGLLGQTLKCSDYEQIQTSMPEAVRDWIERVERFGYVPFAVARSTVAE